MPAIDPETRRPSRPTSPDEAYKNFLMPGQLWAIVQQCWDENPNNRPSSRDLRGSLEQISIPTN
jgi:hypothetical protein